MAHIGIRRKAIALREQGFTYSEIKNVLHIPKSTLSNWLQNFPLSSVQMEILSGRIRNNKQRAVEKISQTKNRRRAERFTHICNQEKETLLPLSDRDVYVAGLMLYWGEGTKGTNCTVSLCNTDPSVLKVFVQWLIHSFNVDKGKLRVSLHLYKDMDSKEMIEYWSNELNIPHTQFIKPYIKQSDSTAIDHSGFSHGTCGIYVYNAEMKRKIMAGIQVFADAALFI